MNETAKSLVKRLPERRLTARRVNPLQSLAVAAALTLPALTNAAIITLDGDDVSFTFDDSTLFGSNVSVIGNTLAFSPSNFEATSSNGSGAQIVSESLVLNVAVTNPAFTISGATLAEEGTSLLLGTGSFAAASGSLRATSQTTLCEGLACTAVTSFATGGLTAADAVWSTGTSTPLAGWNADTRVALTLENLLVSVSTATGPGELAYISKQYVAVGVDLAPVPVPPSVMLLGSALAVGGLLGRRRAAV